MRLEYFQLVDRIVEVDLTQRLARAEAQVPQSSTIFEGHFPGYPLMPGVLLIEAMAQTAGWLLVALNKFERMPFLAAVKDVKLRRFVSPGETLALAASVQHEGSGYAVTTAKGHIDGKPVCDATIMFRVLPFPNDDMRREMVERAEGISLPAAAAADG